MTSTACRSALANRGHDTGALQPYHRAWGCPPAARVCARKGRQCGFSGDGLGDPVVAGA
jgi:hypothetical protein